MKRGETFPRDEIKELHWEPIQRHSAFLCADLSRTHQPHLVPARGARSSLRTQSLSCRETMKPLADRHQRTLTAARPLMAGPEQPTQISHAVHGEPVSSCLPIAAALVLGSSLLVGSLLQPSIHVSLMGDVPRCLTPASMYRAGWRTAPHKNGDLKPGMASQPCSISGSFDLLNVSSNWYNTASTE